MSVKSILTEPNKLLRQVSKSVEKVTKDEQNLMDDMLETMYAANGIGLAAIQIGVPKRIIVMDISKDTEKKFQEYLTIYENNKNNENGWSIYFAISPDGKNSGDMAGDKSLIKKIKAMAIAECMTNSNKEKCYLYAINDEIVWEGASSSSIIIKDENITEKLASLKKLYDERKDSYSLADYKIDCNFKTKNEIIEELKKIYENI